MSKVLSDMFGKQKSPHIAVKSVFQHPTINSLMILNQIALQYPNAIPLGSGRPNDKFCQPLESYDISAFTSLLENEQRPVNKTLGQYGPAAGIINKIVAQHLLEDEKIQVKPEDIVITLGFQEAAELCCKVLFDKDDVLILPDPIFIGITGSALLNNVATEVVQWDGSDFDRHYFNSVVAKIKQQQKIPKAIYVVPDYNNPHGTSLSLKARQQLVAWAKQHNILIFEDNPYSQFKYDQSEKIPALKALAPQQVIYLGSAAKTLFPALRIGYLVAGQTAIIKGQTKPVALATLFAQAKTFMTVNTPAFDQAVFASILLKNKYSLRQQCKPQVEFNKKNLAIMLAALKENFDDNSQVTWNTPTGGYFIVLALPFVFGLEEMRECAEQNNVLVTPVSLLSISTQPRKQVRLAFTNVSEQQIQLAIKNFAAYVNNKLKHKAQPSLIL